MEKNAEIAAELQEASPVLAKEQPGHPYLVPAGYFEQLAEKLAQGIPSGPVLPAITREGFGVPEGYFEGFAGSVLARIRAGNAASEPLAELAEIAPLLHAIPRQEVYTVPAGYFETLSFSAPAPQTGKLVGLRKTRKWMQYAAAAIIASVLVTSAFLFTESPYRKYGRMNVPEELQKMSENDLATYLYNPEKISVVSSKETIGELRENIHGMSDEELTRYLSDNPDAETIVPVSN
ncbi:hypothetical protein [Sediminibacterium soli]|uniref:hypothetical protein n=1 Tax=Sediminibacterium soli TaxID=2698829 RepID=UPI0013798C7F|nr:hypothetical protein [Sediminibacterium soli]NCI47581.1 hypothetical protein [Sediminibacterium soli]